MQQTTIQNPVMLTGIGLHKGVPVHLRLEPAEANSGLVFVRTDKNASVRLSIDSVVDTTMATVIAAGEHKISTIEHLLSAIYAHGIDNLRILVDNEEIPVMDGSSIGFCMLLGEAGIQELDAPKQIMRIKRKIEVKDGDKFVRIAPSDSSIFDFTIDFAHPLIGKQHYRFPFSTKGYKTEIAKARTFGFLHEVQYLRSKNLALGGSLDNAVVLDEAKILNKEGLRYKDEFVRHKILDAMGDMALLGYPIIGDYTSFAGSHHLNHLLTKAILESSQNYEILAVGEQKNSKLHEILALG